MNWINPWFYRSTGVWLVLALSGSGIAGCATSPTAQNKDAQNWKAGRVHKIVEGKDLKDIRERECVVVLPTEEIQRSLFAVVRYSKGRGQQNRTVKIPESSDLKVGDHVRINLSDCTAPIEMQSRSTTPNSSS